MCAVCWGSISIIAAIIGKEDDDDITGELLFWWSQMVATVIVTLCVYMGFKANQKSYSRCCGCCDSMCTSFCASMANRKLSNERNARIKAVLAADKSPASSPMAGSARSPSSVHDITIKI